MWPQLILSGMAIGSMYGLVALGFQMTYAISNTMNFSQGAFVMVGAVLCYSLNITWGLPAIAAVALTLILCAALGGLIERWIVRPFARNGSHAWLLSTIALGIITENVAMLTFGKEVRGYPSRLAETPVSIFNFGVYPLELVILVVGLATAIGLRLLFNQTLWGKAFRAASEISETARLLGVPVTQLIALSFSLSTALAGLAGMLIAPIANVSATMGTLLGVKAFATAMIGGLSNPGGVMLAGVMYGVVESVAAGLLGGSYREIVGFAVVIAVLTVRPNGLFGRALVKKV